MSNDYEGRVKLADHNFYVSGEPDGSVTIMVDREILSIDDDTLGHGCIRLIAFDAIEFANAILAAAGGRQ
jgi:hypothetical protein